MGKDVAWLCVFGTRQTKEPPTKSQPRTWRPATMPMVVRTVQRYRLCFLRSSFPALLTTFVLSWLLTICVVRAEFDSVSWGGVLRGPQDLGHFRFLECAAPWPLPAPRACLLEPTPAH